MKVEKCCIICLYISSKDHSSFSSSLIRRKKKDIFADDESPSTQTLKEICAWFQLMKPINEKSCYFFWEVTQASINSWMQQYQVTSIAQQSTVLTWSLFPALIEHVPGQITFRTLMINYFHEFHNKGNLPGNPLAILNQCQICFSHSCWTYHSLSIP